MTGLKKTIIRSGLETLYFSGAHHLMRPFVGGVGVILTLHHVRPPRCDRFQPNRLLEVTPSFFEDVVRRLRRSRVDLISSTKCTAGSLKRDLRRRFVCITFDDGYRDTLQLAYPILKKYEVPFAVYVPTSFPDRIGELWWLALEAVIAATSASACSSTARSRASSAPPSPTSAHVFEQLYWWLRSLEDRGGAAQRHRATCRRAIMSISPPSATNCA